MPTSPFAQKEATLVHAAPLDLTSVRDVQRAINLLHEKGFLQREAATEPLRESGVVDKDTHTALVAFQRAMSLHPTGQLDATTRGMITQALAAVGATAYPGQDVQQLPPLPVPGGGGGGGGAPAHAPHALHLTQLAGIQRAFNLLSRNGYIQLPHALPEDGVLGEPTHNAIVAFQQMSGFPPTGLLDFNTRSTIAGWLQQLSIHADPGPQGTIDPAAPAAPAPTHTPTAPSFGTPPGAPMVIASVQDVQNALNMLAQYGRAPLRHYLYVTGIIDHPTSDALATFQLAYGLPPTRTIDVPTRAMIAQLLGQVGVSAYSPSASQPHVAATGGAPPTVDRDAQIRKVALGCLAELRHAGVNQVGESMRYLVSTPSLDALRTVVMNLGQPNAGGFANSVAQLWRPSLDYYMMQPDPGAAFAPDVQSKIVPLLSQVDAVLSALGQLAATPTVDNLSATVSRLSQTQGGIASHIADTLRVVLAVVTATASFAPAAAQPA